MVIYLNLEKNAVVDRQNRDQHKEIHSVQENTELRKY